jgi:hypothetical protein
VGSAADKATVFQCVRNLLLAAIATWAFSVRVYRVTQDRSVHISGEAPSRTGSSTGRMAIVLASARCGRSPPLADARVCCCTSLLLRHEAQCYIARAAGRDERRYLWI